MPENPLKGFTLLEVLISLTLLSLILLSLNAAETGSLRMSRNNYYFSVAARQLESLSEYLFSHRSEDEINLFLSEWSEENTMLLPKGRGVLAGRFPSYTLSLCWGEKNCVTHSLLLAA